MTVTSSSSERDEDQLTPAEAMAVVRDWVSEAGLSEEELEAALDRWSRGEDPLSRATRKIARIARRSL
jgi:hypothetical protein